MANLDFRDKHNMVAFLKKPEGSAGFHQIVDFLNSTHIKYTLTENPTIYVSLIHQFWQTAFARTPENKEMEITATIDGRVKTVTKASIRRHLKLEDYNGISTLPNTEIFEQLALMGQMRLVIKERDDRVVRATTTAASKDVAQASGVNTPRSDEERNEQQDLTRFFTTNTPMIHLSQEVTHLEVMRGRKSDKTKVMFKDSEFDVLDDAMENVAVKYF
ncbi:hypothetical protein Tco_1202377 [Tanacetum coccineum]